MCYLISPDDTTYCLGTRHITDRNMSETLSYFLFTYLVKQKSRHLILVCFVPILKSKYVKTFVLFSKSQKICKLIYSFLRKDLTDELRWTVNFLNPIMMNHITRPPYHFHCFHPRNKYTMSDVWWQFAFTDVHQAPTAASYSCQRSWQALGRALIHGIYPFYCQLGSHMPR